LDGLSASYKTNWGIRNVGGIICLPNLFGEEGRGVFLRAVDGAVRRPGSEEGDAIRNITGELRIGQSNGFYSGYGNGAFELQPNYYSRYATATTTELGQLLRLNVSQIVPTAEDNHPLNLGMTPVIYLGE